ncbi:primosomal protein N', partial [Candidatus Peregrinibacteria bacterium CG_4_9_14_0_2_um_filter_41_14]
MQFAEVYLPTLKSVTATKTYTYSVPSELNDTMKLGQLIEVPFGKKTLPALIKALTNTKPDFATKDVSHIIIDIPLINTKIANTIDKIADYYLSTPHRVSSLFLPKQLLGKTWEPKLNKKTGKIQTSSFIRKLEKVELPPNLTPTNEQAEIIAAITPEIQKKIASSHLILGPTGSGKTEIYLQLIKKLKPGQQALLLVPEISLTPQLAQYFYNHFGTEVCVWHSELNATEKKNAWWSVKNNETRVVIGSRSSLFFAFNDLGLIIIDEEQASAFKQDQNPRYHSRDVAKQFSKEYNCPLVLGTATPSLETYQQTLDQSITLHTLTKRIFDTKPPSIQIVDMKDEFKKGNYSIFSDDLLEAIQTTVASQKQVLLFLNRRGFSSSIQCFECGHIEECQNCDISLTLHNTPNKKFLQCHLCGQFEHIPTKCSKCYSRKIKNIGIGTQQVEKTLQTLIPGVRTLRADKDTTTAKHSFQEIYTSFKNHEADILIGTQMISKGLHLPKVDLVGVILADIGLHVPDFRAGERSFQLLKQVCGRAGRLQDQGQVIIQTLSPTHPVLLSLQDDNLFEFYTKELLLRRQHNFPPTNRITKFTYVHANRDTCLKTARQAEQNLRSMQIKFLGAPALIFRQYNNYHYNILAFTDQPQTIVNKLAM